MRLDATRIILTVMTLGLAACGGTGSVDSIASRVARAASHSLVDAVSRANEEAADPSSELSSEPLELASSRPNAIIQDDAEDSLVADHEDAMEQARKCAITIDGDRVTARAISEYEKRCSEKQVTPDAGKAPEVARETKAACVLLDSTSPAGNNPA